MEEFMENMERLEEQRVQIAAKRETLEKSIQVRKDIDSKYLDVQKKNAEEELKSIRRYKEKMKERYKHYEDMLEMNRRNMELSGPTETSLQKLAEEKKAFLIALTARYPKWNETFRKESMSVKESVGALSQERHIIDSKFEA